MAWSVYGGGFGGGKPSSPGAPTAVGPVGPAAETTAALDAVLERVRQGGIGAQGEYWKMVMDRPNWCFLCNADHIKAELEKHGGDQSKVQPQPLLWNINDKTMIGVFTSEAAAMETHRQIHNATPETKDSDLPPAAILTMPVPEAIRWLFNVPADKVSDVVINRRVNVNVAHIGIAMLPRLYEWSTDRLPDALWDGFVKSVQEANQTGAWARLQRRFGMIDPWWLPADPGGANTPLVAVDGEKSYLVLATHTEAAARAFQRVVGDAAKDMKPRIGPIQRDKLLKLIDTIGAEVNGPKHAVINPGGRPAVIALADLGKILRQPPQGPSGF